MNDMHRPVFDPPIDEPIRFRPSSKVFFYSGWSDESSTYAMVATIDRLPSEERVLTIRKEFRPDSFSRWDVVTSAVSLGKAWLVFYNAGTGEVATGQIDDRYDFIEGREYGPGTLPVGYARAAADSDGNLLFAGSHPNSIPNAPESRITRAQLIDEQLLVLWSSEVEIPPPDDLVGLSDGFAWLRESDSESPGGFDTTVYVLGHNGTLENQRIWPTDWGGIVFHSNAGVRAETGRDVPDALLLSSPTGAYISFQPGEICVVEPDIQGRRQLVTTMEQNVAIPHGTISTAISTENGILGYNIFENMARICLLSPWTFEDIASPSTFSLNVKNATGPGHVGGYLPQPHPAWEHIVAC
ncbi:hypothetical protein ACFQ6N_17305 [Kitasatospora sp. NPDC056446]|uniref:hypothetical protein n=1 Tax=Kitasatospora sp. NPDC056446 TaxID=3345819 RepID=UPI003679CB56